MNSQSHSIDRIEWIDYSKGILIILVVMGHAISEFSLDLNFLSCVIYSFHMPSFFILNGYVFKYKDDLQPSAYIKKKSKQLLIPYIVFCSCILFCHILKQLILHTDSAFFERLLNKETLLKTFFMTYESIFSNMWFLPAMLSATCIMYFIYKGFRSNSMRNIVGLACGLGALFWGRFVRIGLPIDLEAAFLAVLFIQFGVNCRKYQIDKVVEKKIAFILYFTVLLALNYISSEILLYSENSFYNIKFENELFFIITAISGIGIVVGISKRVKRSKWLNFLGKNSLYIYGFHFISQNIIGFIKWPTNTSILVRLLLLIIISGLNILLSIFITICYKEIVGYIVEKRKYKGEGNKCH